MKRRKIILIGALPPPFDGQTVAFKIIVDGVNNSGLKNNVVNISSFQVFKSSKLQTVNRILDYIFVLIKLFISCFPGHVLIYLQTSQSRKGFYRDKMIVTIAKWFNAKIIGHLHGGYYDGLYQSQDESMKKLMRNELKRYDRMIVLSNNLKNMFDMQPLLRHRIMCIPNGTGEKIDPIIEKKIDKYNAQNPIRILYLSNLIESKGYLVVLESLRILKENNIYFKAHFCGKIKINSDESSYNSDEEAYNDFFDKIKKYALSENVIYEGVVTGEKKDTILKESNFFILPTNYINEGQPISIIEAMRYGNIVIATNYRAIPEMIEHKKSGYLINDRNPLEISNFIRECIHNPELYSTISKNAIVRYNENFTEIEHCNKLISVIKYSSLV